jgi:hypothetical protein
MAQPTLSITNTSISNTFLLPRHPAQEQPEFEEVTQDSFASIFTAATQQTGTGNQGPTTQGGSGDSNILLAHLMAQMFDCMDQREAARQRASQEAERRRDLAQSQREQAFLRGLQTMQSSAGSGTASKGPQRPSQ